jgi:molybdopterin converting factor small subunit
VSVTVNIHKTHRTHTDGQSAVQVAGGNVGDCLQDLTARYPGMEAALFSGPGKLRDQIEIYLNMESTYPEELRKPVQVGDEIHIIVMLAGG